MSDGLWLRVSEAHEKHTRSPSIDQLRNEFIALTCQYWAECLDPDRHILHTTPDMSVEILALFTFPENKHIDIPKDIIRKQISSCLPCMESYHAAKQSFAGKYGSIYSPAALMAFSQALDRWDLSRLAESLTKFIDEVSKDPTQTKAVRQKSIFVFLELLDHPELLRFSSIGHLFAQLVLKTQANSTLTLRERLLPGILVLAIHRNPDIRSWILKVIAKAAIKVDVSDVKVLEPAFRIFFSPVISFPAASEYLVHSNKGEVWKPLAELLRLFTPAALDEGLLIPFPELDRFCCNALLDLDGGPFWGIFLSFARMLSLSQRGFWRRPSFDVSPAAVFRRITSHPDFVAYLKTPAKDTNEAASESAFRANLEWVAALVDQSSLASRLSLLEEMPAFLYGYHDWTPAARRAFSPLAASIWTRLIQSHQRGAVHDRILSALCPVLVDFPVPASIRPGLIQHIQDCWMAHAHRVVSAMDQLCQAESATIGEGAMPDMLMASWIVVVGKMEPYLQRVVLDVILSQGVVVLCPIDLGGLSPDLHPDMVAELNEVNNWVSDLHSIVSTILASRLAQPETVKMLADMLQTNIIKLVVSGSPEVSVLATKVLLKVTGCSSLEDAIAKYIRDDPDVFLATMDSTRDQIMVHLIDVHSNDSVLVLRKIMLVFLQFQKFALGRTGASGYISFVCQSSWPLVCKALSSATQLAKLPSTNPDEVIALLALTFEHVRSLFSDRVLSTITDSSQYQSSFEDTVELTIKWLRAFDEATKNRAFETLMVLLRRAPDVRLLIPKRLIDLISAYAYQVRKSQLTEREREELMRWIDDYQIKHINTAMENFFDDDEIMHWLDQNPDMGIPSGSGGATPVELGSPISDEVKVESSIPAPRKSLGFEGRVIVLDDVEPIKSPPVVNLASPKSPSSKEIGSSSRNAWPKSKQSPQNRVQKILVPDRAVVDLTSTSKSSVMQSRATAAKPVEPAAKSPLPIHRAAVSPGSGSLFQNLAKSSQVAPNIILKKPMVAKPALPKPSANLSKLQQLRKEIIASESRTGAFVPNRGQPRRPPVIGSAPLRPARVAPENRSGMVLGGSDSEDDSGLRDLAADLVPKTGSVQKRSIQMLDYGVGVSGKRPRGRLINEPTTAKDEPLRDINQLHRLILEWSLNLSDEIPPNFKFNLTNVPSTFRNVEEYAATFEPLLVLECWQKLMKAKEELNMDDTTELTIKGVQAINDFHDISFAISSDMARQRDLSESDLIQISESRAADGGQIAILGIIRSMQFRKNECSLVCRVYLAKRYNYIPRMNVGSVWRALRIFALTPVEREYAAMILLSSCSLLPQILQPQKAPKPTFSRGQVDDIIKTYNVNPPQAEAILAAQHQTTGFTLIQGPPGTGKTQTILGIIASLLSPKNVIAVPVADRSKSVEASSTKATANKRRLLCCAPSNAACDEIVRRVKTGIPLGNGTIFRPKVVRIGKPEVIHEVAKEVSLDTLVEKQLKGQDVKAEYDLTQDESLAQKESILREKIRALSDKRDAQRREMSESRGDGSDQTVREMSQKIQEIGRELDAIRSQRQNAIKNMDQARHRARAKVVWDADVVFCTLTSAGHELLGSIQDLVFPTVIIDEACQSVELQTLIPLRFGVRKCIMVGDPNQLPPTVVSQVAQSYSYERSLFQRIMECSRDSVHLLSIQYRMHPEISAFPSLFFYDSALKDADGMAEKCSAPWHTNPSFPPYCFMDVHSGREEQSRGFSLFNMEEVGVCVNLVDYLCRSYPKLKFAGKIGVITPYKRQMRELRSEFMRRFGSAVLKYIDVNTIDGFQGQEKEIIVLSCVRASQDKGIGFLGDVRRMNVAFTRAQKSLFIVGNSESLLGNPTWKALVVDAERRKVSFKVSRSSFPLSGPMSTNLVDASAASAPRASTSNKPRNQGHRDDSRQKAPPKVVKASTAGQGSKDGAGSRPSHRGDSSVSGERSTPAAPPQSADRLEERKKRAPKAEDQGAPSRKGQPSSDQPESRGSSRPRERGLNEGKQAEREKAPSRESDSTKERSRLGDRPRETGGGPSGNRSDSHARRPDDARSHTTDRSREPSRNSDRDRSKFGDRDSSHRPSSDPARAHTSPSEGSAARPANDKRKISDRLGEPVPPKEWHKKPKHR